MSIGWAILDEEHNVVIATAEELDKWLKKGFEKKIVKQQHLSDGRWVSTVFLGLDHQFGEGPPLYFETMVFPNSENLLEDRCERYETWNEALSGHEQICKEEETK